MSGNLACSILAIATLAGALPAAADEMTDRSVAIVPRAGFLGAGADLSFPLAERFNGRIGYGSLSRTGDYTETNFRYDGKLKFAGGLAVIDWFPTNGKFRLSAGVARNQSNIRVTANPTSAVTFGNNVYPASSISASGELNFAATAPYLGVGYGNPSAGGRIGFFLEGGLIRQKTKATLTGTCTGSCGTFDADLAQERADLQNSASDMRWFPVLQVGMSIRF